MDVFPELSLAEAEREIDAHIFSRSPEADHAAKLLRVTQALSLLGDPHHELDIIHVTGTNGKTSTSRMMESLLRAHGLRTGLYTSPHLTTLRERIMIDGAPLAQEDLIRLWQRVAPVIHAVDQASQHRGGPRMSFFEVLTVLGFVAYADAEVDVLVLEVGIGGLRDATNVADGRVAVLTPMALDHDKYFTGGLPGIAHEKSGIIKPGATVVSALQRDEASQVIVAAAAARGASVFWEGAHLSVESRRVVPSGQVVSLRTAARNYRDVFVPLHGEFQAQNALIALAACETFLGAGVPRGLHPPAVARGFAGATSPGRLEVVSAEPTVIVDAAHNPHGIAALADTLRESFAFDRTYGVVAVLADKDAEGILTGLSGIIDEVVITQTRSHRAADAEVLAARARVVFGEHRVRVAATVPDAIQLATRLAEDADGEAGVLVAGSITLVAEARRHLQETHLPRTVDAAMVAAAGEHADAAGGADDAVGAGDAGEPGNVAA
ncbi:folylpolyglutamate synthase/dihydrofolate synthase family protein [Demequina sp. SYSU T00039]|uniref:tetrahydrofolate synthase n=1 Tax=Demequina lignilytica TaxID=3051663 RepID=A0AAW7M001_9MICO|nr:MULTISPECIES: folylpolyglutamate synthase/dihydrofolate synthase family protein [unclassified Demequina]MDN4477235.1 folylpolyglutamate synthase/dihydrofolate synthase family protein [Demequina sp. SYSU T00039-1]MDN4487408.1 folylpolyglutamate synthase/dihydrofolate synthase family protein [Demequina sp. SYSU T00039]MDN4491161.1 folylpolyglutamate synthase/dihydrofolate synthase family protein [Demequina sp. SYSU T00068]